jgi:hypothetical protein
MDFETRIREFITKLVTPIIKLSTEERESNLEMEIKNADLQQRCTTLEHAVFKTNNELGRTIFDDYADKISDMNKFLTEKT